MFGGLSIGSSKDSPYVCDMHPNNNISFSFFLLTGFLLYEHNKEIIVLKHLGDLLVNIRF